VQAHNYGTGDDRAPGDVSYSRLTAHESCSHCKLAHTGGPGGGRIEIRKYIDQMVDTDRCRVVTVRIILNIGVAFRFAEQSFRNR
jgi:hypothetical protein